MIACLRKHLEQRCRERGYTLDEVRPCIISEDGDRITVDETHPAYPRVLKPGFVPPEPATSQASGPGTELKGLLKRWLGIEATPTCSCNRMAQHMNRMGPDWCESKEGLEQILGVMRKEHERRKAKGQTILPWTDLGATQLVRLACRRARSAAC